MFYRSKPHTVKDSALAIVLLSIAFAGMWAIESHAYRDERNPAWLNQWPAASTLVPGSGKFHCLLFVHPHCPCSRMALATVERQLAAARVDVDWQIVFVQPSTVAADWHIGSNWQRAQSLSGVKCVLDRAGRNAQVFGAVASGHCFVFDDQGRKLFDGGLTAGRGMEGPCLGQNFLASLGDEMHQPCTAPVYGCPLFESRE